MDLKSYYFLKLCDEEKEIYIDLLNCIRMYDDEVKLPLIPEERIKTVFNYVLLDNPIVFYTSSFCYVKNVFHKKNDY